ncbi:hypothetical protein FDI21_gp060 [Pseudomonas phage Noxifer]|uniref:Uncharacterized protein n=1 Tax=Pseudomonas phage Noxifer TaxID=2006684 RepID=A0A1Y0SUM3_9CAUD|nr:hypothetical protein FDI21_gp060 [Pseudomonas phage Noxifer]ARV77231.1 hypothetical protein NOXIFER_60 [Pseudomonas phage Noxifer]
MSQQQNRPALDPNILDVMSNWLFTDPVPGAQKRPNFRVKVMGNVPRISVKTNVENDKQFGKIDFQTDLATWGAIIGLALDMAEGRDESEGYNFDYKDDFLAGKKLDREMVISTLQIGRDRESGRMYVAVMSSDKSRPRIQFWFGPTKYHDIRNRDGSPLSAKKLSESFARGFLGPISKLVEHLLITQFNPDAKNVAKAMAPGGGGGGGNNYQQGRGGNNYGGGGGNNNYGNQQRQSAPANDAVDFDDFVM